MSKAILKCNNQNNLNPIYDCKSKTQDDRYGFGIRKHNKVKTEVPHVFKFRCSVCGMFNN